MCENSTFLLSNSVKEKKLSIFLFAIFAKSLGFLGEKTNMATPDTHISCLAKLCRTCGKLLGKNSLLVCNNASRINKAFYMNTLCDSVDTHPQNICIKCYSTIRNIENRETTATITTKIWQPHSSDSCDVCANAKHKLKAGRKCKPKRSGRRSNDSKIWTRTVTNNLMQNIPNTNLNQSLKSKITKQWNSHFDLCVCSICNNITEQPVMLECQHSFCLTCVVSKIEGKDENDSKCMTCNAKILLTKINPSIQVREMINCLVVPCELDCGKTFSINDSENKTEHEKLCKGTFINKKSASYTISDIFELSESSEMPRIVEDATVHVMKCKMAKSKSKTVQFPSGGPRVRFNYVCKIPYYQQLA